MRLEMRLTYSSASDENNEVVMNTPFDARWPSRLPANLWSSGVRPCWRPIVLGLDVDRVQTKPVFVDDAVDAVVTGHLGHALAVLVTTSVAHGMQESHHQALERLPWECVGLQALKQVGLDGLAPRSVGGVERFLGVLVVGVGGGVLRLPILLELDELGVLHDRCRSTRVGLVAEQIRPRWVIDTKPRFGRSSTPALTMYVAAQ